MDPSGASGSDFHLADEILAVIPTDPYEQLNLARKITSLAIASRVSKLELETGQLRRQVAEKDRVIADLQEKLSRQEHNDERLRAALEENIKISKERDALASSSKRLARDVAKLETFKRQLMKSLSEDSPSPQEAAVDIKPCEHSIVESSIKEENSSISSISSNLAIEFSEMGSTVEGASKPANQKFSFIPRVTPCAAPKKASTGSSPKGYSSAGSPKIPSGATSPTNLGIDVHIPLTPWYSSSQQSSVANSPPRGRPSSGRSNRIDGKEFFRQARTRLRYEQFGAFLANIKQFNAQTKSLEETLKRAEEIFGEDNKDLFVLFQALLSNRNRQ